MINFILKYPESVLYCSKLITAIKRSNFNLTYRKCNIYFINNDYEKIPDIKMLRETTVLILCILQETLNIDIIQ